MPLPVRRILVSIPIVALVLCSITWGAGKTSLLLLAKGNRIQDLRMFFDGDPCIEYSIVVTQDSRIPDSELIKLIRLYFPRNYQEFRQFEVLILSCPDYNLFTAKQDRWIHDAISQGAGGLNDGSIFSQIPSIYQAWVSGVAWEAFPNDAPAVCAGYASWAQIESFSVKINPDHPEPVLSMFIPFGVEAIRAPGLGRMVIPPTGSSVLAWQVGNYPEEVPYLTAWSYAEGRAMTMGGSFPYGWLTYPTGTSEGNKYAPEIAMNIVFWLADTTLIDDVEVFHSVKSDFAEFVAKMKALISLSDFIDKFGADTKRVQEEIASIGEIYDQAARHYMEHSFVDSETSIKSALARVPVAEELARKEKGKALLWVFIIEWLVSSSALFISGSVLWTLMVRRRFYRAVEVTTLRKDSE